jgi:multiple sugar transport system ATP-binding protein
MNFLPAKGRLAPGTRKVRVNGAEVEVPLLHEPLDHDDAVLGARPEHVEVAADGPLRGRVFGVEYMGARQLVTVDTDAGRLKIRAPNTVRASFGETVGLRFKSDALVVFDGRTDRALKSDLIGGGRG